MAAPTEMSTESLGGQELLQVRALHRAPQDAMSGTARRVEQQWRLQENPQSQLMSQVHGQLQAGFWSCFGLINLFCFPPFPPSHPLSIWNENV